ncbi:family 43 glycosylhydrolase [Bifidobacterium aesculapii]|uniref:family 43 glycosylhydrolase n=1 Tax=Bifidobacterium aesculapii TaxID=1329411 RepID=UPI0006E1DDA7|nr:family 43 glycosylhydrolase [Bifidobacterium aesculapii]
MTTRPTSLGRRLIGAVLAVPMALAGMALGATTAVPAAAADAVQLPTPLASYSFAKDDGKGAVANEAAGSAFGAAQIKSATDADKAGTYEDGALQLTGDEYVKLPDDLLKDKTSATVVAMVKNSDFSISDSKWTYFFTFGGSRLKAEGNWAVSTHNGLYTSITATQNGDNENYFSASSNLSTEKFQLLAATIDGATKQANLYINGRLVGSGTFNTLPNQFKAQNWNTIGNSTYPGVGDAMFHGAIKSFAVYDTALTQSQIVTMIDAEGAADLLNGEIGNLTVPTTASTDFTLKTSTDNASVAWSSSNEKVISVDKAGNAKVTPSTAGDTTVTLTATLSPNTGVPAPPQPVTKTFTVQVPQKLNDEEIVTRDLKALTIENANDMRTNFSVPTKGANGATISWTVKDAGKADPKITDGVNKTSKTVRVSRPAAGAKATTITLTATVTSGNVTQTRDFTVKVQPMPSSKTDTQAYVWMYFTGEGGESQKVSIAASKGDNALDWNALNTNAEGKAEPIMTSVFGEKGLRDPFIMRSHDGDKFYLLATDLKIGSDNNFFNAQAKGSKYLEIWESTDLVNWSNQRHVKVSTDYAGNTWAPEAYWDDELGTYVVYWASNLYDTTDENERTAATYNRMMIATTDDFITFSEPKEWVNVDRRGQAGAGSIDATVQKVGDTYYRIYKDENSMTLREEKSTDLTASIGADGVTDFATALKGSKWTEIGTNIGGGQANGYGGTFTAGEGPSLFKANKGDVNGYQYYLFADQPDYHGGPNHYIPFATTDITDASKWTSVGDKMPESNMPLNSDGGRPRHGTVLGVTRAEYQAVLEAYEPSIAVKSVDALDATTKSGEAPTLPKTAHLTMADGTSKDVDVVWNDVKADDYAKEGTFTVAGVAQDDSRMPVEATVTVAAKAASVETVATDALKVGSNGTATFAEPAAVKGYAKRALTKAPAKGVVTLADDGVRYDALNVANGTFAFTVRYTLKDGSLVDVTYTAEVTAALADATHQRGSSHDPSIVKEGDTYYVFGSHRAWLKSKDLRNWEPFENNLSTDYKTVLGGIWNEWSSKNDAGNTELDGNMWAPDVSWNKTMNKWTMYLSVNGGGKGNYQKTVIVLLTADHLDGDWTYVGPVVYSGFQDADVAATDVDKVSGVLTTDGKVPARYKSLDDTGVNAIDADVHTDDDGQLWMSFGSWFGGIWAIKLDPATGLRDYTATYTTKADASDAYYGVKLAGGHNNSGEGASFVKRGDWWYMFVSYGNLGVDGGYQIREFRSKSLTGPYVDQNGNPAIYTSVYGNPGSGANKTINRGLRVLSTVEQNGSAEIRAAQGGNEVYVADDGAIYNVYHTRFVSKTAAETATKSDNELRVQQMVVSPDGWLVSTPYEYSGAFRQKASYTMADVAGDYQIAVNDPTRSYATNTETADEATRLADAGIVHAVDVRLNEDGTLSGRAQGTWELDGNAVTLHVTAAMPGSNLMGDYTGTLAGQPNETGGYALVFGAVGGTVFTDAGTDVKTATPGATAIWGAKQTAWPSDEDPDNPSGPDDGKNDGTLDDGKDTADGSKKPGLSATGTAVLGVGGMVVLLAAAGIGLTIWRKRKA